MPAKKRPAMKVRNLTIRPGPEDCGVVASVMERLHNENVSAAYRFIVQEYPRLMAEVERLLAENARLRAKAQP